MLEKPVDFSSATDDFTVPDKPDFNPSPLGRKILKNLADEYSPKCICHIAADIHVEERHLYPVVAALWASGSVDFLVPQSQEDPYASIDDQHLEDWELDVKRMYANKKEYGKRLEFLVRNFEQDRSKGSPFSEKLEGAAEIFSELRDSEFSPRYYVTIAGNGRARLAL